jgi:hypothetical protein
MKKEFWFEEMRLSFKRLKKADLTLGQILGEKRTFDLHFDNLIRVAGSDIGIDVETAIPTKFGFFKRFWLWLKSFKEIF